MKVLAVSPVRQQLVRMVCSWMRAHELTLVDRDSGIDFDFNISNEL